MGVAYIGIDHTQCLNESSRACAQTVHTRMRIHKEVTTLDLLSNSISYQFHHHLNLKFSFGRGTASGGVRGGWNVVHEATTVHQIDNAHNHGIYSEETYDDPSNTIERRYAVADDEE